MSTLAAARWLWLEGAAIAIGYAVAGAAAGDRPRGARELRGLLALLASHAVVVAIAWRVAAGPGELAGQGAARLVFAAEGALAWSLGAALARLRIEPGVAAALAAVLVLLLVAAPALAEALAGSVGAPARVRSLAFAASPPWAAAVALGVDILHDATLYERLPAASLELHMIAWTSTALGLGVTAGALGAVAVARRPRRRTLSTLLLLAALAAAGCKSKGKTDGAPTGGTAAPAALDAGAAPPAPDAAAAATAPPTAAELDAMIAKGVEFLAKARGPGDLIGGHPGVNAMAALAMVSAGVPGSDPRVAPSLEALAKLAHPDGSIVDKDMPVYVTAISVLAFQRASVHPELIAPAQQWLVGKQFGGDAKDDPKNPNYGGIGYGIVADKPDADLSNLHFALDAIKDATIKDKDAVMARAQKFLERCQNRTESNDQPWAGNDGGFVYKPGASKAGGTVSSGSMTYAGIAGFLYAKAAPDDPRVAAAMSYIRANYSVDENPGLGLKGLYYHHHMMARALSLAGARQITDSDGAVHDWPTELADRLRAAQKPDGSWANTDATYWENNPPLATARAVLALVYARDAMK
ncbi:MAG: terpene cyclase/mutase family protein [Kofleriaceae bacterium]|nr:terpene cyclase/mutase family protein [Kofleriaceae bacterium]